MGVQGAEGVRFHRNAPCTKIGEGSGPSSRRKGLGFGVQSRIRCQMGHLDARLRLSAASGRRGAEEESYSGTEELVQWERVSVQDEDAFIIEGQFGGLPGDMGGVDGFGLLLLRLGEQGGHTDRLHGFDVVGWLGRGAGCR